MAVKGLKLTDDALPNNANELVTDVKDMLEQREWCRPFHYSLYPTRLH